MRWMKLEPIIQSEVSQKEKHQYGILTHIYGILKDGNDNPVHETAKETQMYRTVFWSLWEREKWSEVKSLSRVWLFATPWTVAYQAPLSLGFSMQECWSGLPFPSPRESSQPRDQTQVSCIAGRLFTIWATREAHSHVRWVQLYGSLNILWHCLSLGLEWKLTFSSPVATLGTENSAKQGNSWSSHYSRRDK